MPYRPLPTGGKILKPVLSWATNGLLSVTLANTPNPACFVYLTTYRRHFYAMPVLSKFAKCSAITGLLK